MPRKDSKKPPKGELERLYTDEKLTITRMAEIYKASRSTVGNWLDEDDIPRRSRSDALKLRWASNRPTKAVLEYLYNEENLPTTKIANKFNASAGTVCSWMDEDGIERRSLSESKKVKSNRPAKEVLEYLYNEDKLLIRKIAAKYNVSSGTVYRWMDEDGLERSRMNKITSNGQFKDFLRQNRPALSLVAAAASLNGQGYEVENVINGIYEGKFKNQTDLHRLITENKDDILNLVREGITNLGPYIGEFSLGDREIIPVLLGEALSNIPESRIESSLENRLLRILRSQYSPQFNEDPGRTMGDIASRLEGSDGKIRRLYERLYEHYEQTIKLQEEIGNA